MVAVSVALDGEMMAMVSPSCRNCADKGSSVQRKRNIKQMRLMGTKVRISEEKTKISLGFLEQKYLRG